MVGSVVADYVTSGSSTDALAIMDPTRFTSGGAS
jgi:sarcosine oxidase